MNIAKSPLGKLLLIKESLIQQIQSESSVPDARILGEWYAISTLIHKFYRTSFHYSYERNDFESRFFALKDNRARADCLLNHEPFVKKIRRYSSNLISEVSLIKCKKALRLPSLLRSKYKNQENKHDCEDDDDDADDDAMIEQLSSQELKDLKHIIISEKLENFKEMESMPGISDKLCLTLFPPKRRGYMAMEDIQSEDILSVQRAVGVWLSPHYYNSYCYQCYTRLSDESVTCGSCKVCNFCTRRCFQKAKSSFHDKECNYMSILKHLSVVHFVIRLIMKVGFDRFVELEMEKDGLICFEPGGDRSKRFVDLDDSVNNIPQEDVLSFTCTAVFISHLLVKMDILPHKSSHRIMVASCVNAIVTSARNLYTIYDHSFRPRKIALDEYEDKVEALVEGRSKELGYGLYYTTSLFNHSCTPDSYAVFLGDHIVIVAQRFVPAGGEVTISYGTTFPNTKWPERQRKLMDNFYFTCACEQCLKGEEVEAIELAELKAAKRKLRKKRKSRRKNITQSNVCSKENIVST